MSKDKKISKNQKESEKILKRLKGDYETIGQSTLAKNAEQSLGYNNSQSTEQKLDKTEIWGTKIGRFLGIIFVIFLIVHLTTTYIL